MIRDDDMRHMSSTPSGIATGRFHTPLSGTPTPLRRWRSLITVAVTVLGIVRTRKRREGSVDRPGLRSHVSPHIQLISAVDAFVPELLLNLFLNTVYAFAVIAKLFGTSEQWGQRSDEGTVAHRVEGGDDPTGAMTVSLAARSTGSHGWRAAWWARIIESSAARLWQRSSNGDIPGLGLRLGGSSAHR